MSGDNLLLFDKGINVRSKNELKGLCKICINYPCSYWDEDFITSNHDVRVCRMFEPKDELQKEHFSCLMMVQGIDCEGCPRRFTCHEQPTIEERNCDNCNHKHCFACLCHRYYHYYYESKDELQTREEGEQWISIV